MLIGHNPGVQDLALRLTGSGAGDLRSQAEAKFPTGAMATLSFGDGWASLGDGVARLDDLFVPRPPRI